MSFQTFFRCAPNMDVLRFSRGQLWTKMIRPLTFSGGNRWKWFSDEIFSMLLGDFVFVWGQTKRRFIQIVKPVPERHTFPRLFASGRHWCSRLSTNLESFKVWTRRKNVSRSQISYSPYQNGSASIFSKGNIFQLSFTLFRWWTSKKRRLFP